MERNGTVYVVLLDSAKAFDTVPHDALRIFFMSMENVANCGYFLTICIAVSVDLFYHRDQYQKLLNENAEFGREVLF